MVRLQCLLRLNLGYPNAKTLSDSSIIATKSFMVAAVIPKRSVFQTCSGLFDCRMMPSFIFLTQIFFLFFKFLFINLTLDIAFFQNIKRGLFVITRAVRLACEPFD